MIELSKEIRDAVMNLCKQMVELDALIASANRLSIDRSDNFVLKFLNNAKKDLFNQAQDIIQGNTKIPDVKEMTTNPFKI